MGTDYLNQRIITEFKDDDYLLIWLDQFLLDKRVQNVAPGTLSFYREKLTKFTDYPGSSPAIFAS